VQKDAADLLEIQLRFAKLSSDYNDHRMERYSKSHSIRRDISGFCAHGALGIALMVGRSNSSTYQEQRTSFETPDPRGNSVHFPSDRA